MFNVRLFIPGKINGSELVSWNVIKARTRTQPYNNTDLWMGTYCVSETEGKEKTDEWKEKYVKTCIGEKCACVVNGKNVVVESTGNYRFLL